MADDHCMFDTKDPRRTWITIGDFRISYDGCRRVDIDPIGHPQSSLMMTRGSFIWMIQDINAQANHGYNMVGLPEDRPMPINDPRREWTGIDKPTDIIHSFNGVDSVDLMVKSDFLDGKLGPVWTLNRSAIYRILELFKPEPFLD